MTLVSISKNRTVAILIALALLMFGLEMSGKTLAASGGITIAPAIISLDLAPSDQQQVAYVGVKNNFSVPVSLSAEFNEVDQDSGTMTPVKSLDDNLSKIMSVEPAIFTLEPNASVNLKITVTNNSQLGPGGSYAALVVKQTNNGTNAVGLQSAISVSVFIIKEQGAIRAVELGSVKLERFLLEAPTKATLVFANKGNVMAVPRGVLTIGNAGLETVYAKGIVNEGSLSFMPSKQLSIDVPISNLARKWLPGRQTVNVQYRTEGDGKIQTYEATVLYSPSLYLLVPLAIIVVAGFVLRRRWPIKSKKRRTSASEVAPLVTGAAPKTIKKIVVTADNDE
jgi:hypothetical protein